MRMIKWRDEYWIICRRIAETFTYRSLSDGALWNKVSSKFSLFVLVCIFFSTVLFFFFFLLIFSSSPISIIFYHISGLFIVSQILLISPRPLQFEEGNNSRIWTKLVLYFVTFWFSFFNLLFWCNFWTDMLVL